MPVKSAATNSTLAISGRAPAGFALNPDASHAYQTSQHRQAAQKKIIQKPEPERRDLVNKRNQRVMKPEAQQRRGNKAECKRKQRHPQRQNFGRAQGYARNSIQV